MKTIGIAAVTAPGAANCYQDIVLAAASVLGNNSHPTIVLHHASFATLLEAQNRHDWGRVAELLAESINATARAGADFAIIPANSVHFAFDQTASLAKIPVLSIVELAAEECHRLGYRRVGVLGVGMTMSDGLYDDVLARHAITSELMAADDISKLDEIIYSELVHNDVRPDSVHWIQSIAANLKRRGCDAILLACTELNLALKQSNSPLPLIDTTHLLAQKAVEASLKD